MYWRRSSRRFLNMYILAGDETTAADTLRRLAASRCEKVRLRVAENTSTPADILAMLAGDRHADVKAAVATNPSCPPELARSIAHDPDIVVRHALAQSINLPLDILQALCEDENAWVKVEAQKTMQILRSWTSEELQEARAHLKAERDAFGRIFGRTLGGAKRLKAKFKLKVPGGELASLVRRLKKLFVKNPDVRCA